MTSYLLTGPVSEPVSLAEAKAYLRIDDGAEDALVTTLIAAARLHVEGIAGRALLTQSWRLVLDAWPEDRLVRLPVGPVSIITAIRAYDHAGTAHAISLAQFQTLAGENRLLLPISVAGMPVTRERAGIEVDYVAGFGTAADVPQDLRQALLGLIAHWFEHRDAVIVAGSGAVVPVGFDRLIERYRQVRL